MKEMTLNLETAKKRIIEYTKRIDYADKLEIIETKKKNKYPDFTFKYLYYNDGVISKVIIKYTMFEFTNILKESLAQDGYDVKEIWINKINKDFKLTVYFGLFSNLTRKRKLYEQNIFR